MFMNGIHGKHSSALLVAQQRLLALRQQHRREDPQPSVNDEPLVDEEHTLAISEDVQFSSPVTSSVLPAHLGWNSAPLTSILRNRCHSTLKEANDRKRTPFNRRETGASAAIWNANPAPAFHPSPNDTIKLFPDIALGMLRQEHTAAGRIWLLLRYLDQEGKGWIRIANTRKNLSTKYAPIRVCGWRQLRNLLRQGDDVFWTRDKTRIWLKSAATVAAALDVTHLTSKPVALSVRVLTSSIAQVRAHLYSSFHSGRSREDQRQPIARETLALVTGVGRRTQQVYESLTGLSVQHNYAIGEQYSPETAVRHAWHRGQATFVLQDSHGEQGKRGRSYIAWQLPNSYSGCHPHAPKGRQRRINRKLADLVIIGAPGNNRERLHTRYYPDGKQAVRATSRHPEWAVYWWRQRTRNGRSDLWQQLG
jgi:hypothetical protein